MLMSKPLMSKLKTKAIARWEGQQGSGLGTGDSGPLGSVSLRTTWGELARVEPENGCQP